MLLSTKKSSAKPKPKCHDPCQNECRTCHRPERPCSHDCCELVQQRIIQSRRDRASFRHMQQQLAAGLREAIPKYAKRPKPTAGSGHGCGAPPRRTLPPLWMYSLGTQRPPHRPVHREIRRRKTDHLGQRHSRNGLRPLSYADEIGTHRNYIQS